MPAAATFSAGPDTAASSAYTLGAGDTVTVTVLHQPDFSVANQQIRPDGTLSLPVVGSMQAAGRSPDELASAIKARLQRYLDLPTVLVVLDSPRPLYVNVVGAVIHPGLVQVPRGVPSVMEALALSGGLAPKSDAHHVHLLSANGTRRLELDLAGYLSGSVHAPLPRLHDGDTLVVDALQVTDWTALLETGLGVATFLLTLYTALRR